MSANRYSPAEAVAWFTHLWLTQTPVAVGYCDRLYGRGYGHLDTGEVDARHHALDPLVTDKLPGQVGGIGAGAVYVIGEHWHIAPIADNLRSRTRSYILSPDVVHPGRVNKVPIMYPCQRWGATFWGSIGAQFPRASGLYVH